MRIKLFFVVLILPFIFPSITKAQVVINEFSSASNPEWVEIYNTSTQTVSLNEYSIHFDDNLDIQKYNFCENDQIEGNSYRLIILSSSYLNNEGDTITLRKNGVTEDSITYGSGQTIPKLENNQSGKRDPDGSTNWIVSNSPLQNGAQVSFSCPTPTATPTEIPTATPTPTNTPTITPTATPTKTATPKPTVKATPKPSPSPTSSATPEGEILAATDIPTGSLPPTVVEDQGKKEIPFAAVAFLVGGVVALVLAGLSYQKIRQKENGKKEEIS